MSKKLTMRKMKMAILNQHGNTVAVYGKRNGHIMTDEEQERAREENGRN